MAINMHAHMWDEDIDARVEHCRHERVTHTVMSCNDDEVEWMMRKRPASSRRRIPTLRRSPDRGRRHPGWSRG